MKKIFSILAAAALMVGCGSGAAKQESALNLMKTEDFTATVDGKPVSLYTLTNGTITMQVTNFGGRVVSLWTPDRDGNMEDIVLGYDKLERYVNNTGERFLGAVVGRVANRIGAGKFTLDGKEYNTPLNNNGQTLHGGTLGVDRIVWDVGHQIYVHKLLTGRLDSFSTLRREDGISGFVRPDESEHDSFYEGHAGVSVSQAAGIAAANAVKGSKNYAVAVIGKHFI